MMMMMMMIIMIMMMMLMMMVMIIIMIMMIMICLLKFNMADYNNVPLVCNVNMVATARGFWNSLTFSWPFPNKCKIFLTNGINKFKKLLLVMETTLPFKAILSTHSLCFQQFRCSLQKLIQM